MGAGYPLQGEVWLAPRRVVLLWWRGAGQAAQQSGRLHFWMPANQIQYQYCSLDWNFSISIIGSKIIHVPLSGRVGGV